MSLSCEQLFYGRDERGYGILGASRGALHFAPRIEALCGAVGTPAVNYSGEPFLLSVPEGGRVIMLCGRRGTPDSMKRETLFFHVLIAEKTALAAANANAFTLFEQGAFAGRLPDGEIQAVSFIANPGEAGSAASCRASLPCFIRSDKPAPDAVRELVGTDANEVTWATFAFQTLGGFDVQVLSHRIAAPLGASEYDTAGGLIRSSKAASPRATEAVYEATSARQDAASPDKKNHNSSAMFKVSLAGNIVLAVLCAVMFTARGTDAPETQVSSDGNPVIVTNTIVSTKTFIVTNTITEQIGVVVGRDDTDNLKKAAEYLNGRWSDGDLERLRDFIERLEKGHH